MNYYQNKTDDEIATRLILDPNVEFEVPTYTNVQGKKTKGLEIDLTYLVSTEKQFYWRASKVFDVKDLETDTDISDITIVQTHSIGLLTNINDKLSFNSHILYNGKWGKAKSYALLNLNSSYRFHENLTASFNIYNLTDQKFDYSIWQSDWQSETLPAGKPRTFSIEIDFTW